MFLLPHPLSLSQREREYFDSLSLWERAGVRATTRRIIYAAHHHFTINPMAATTTPSMAAIHLSKSTFDSAIAAFVSAFN